MYLISIYFEEKTDSRIRSFIKQIAKNSGNTAMLDGNVPPHITISAFQTDSEEHAKEIFDKAAQNISTGAVQWVSVGAFFPRVLYLAPLLNEYLYDLSVTISKEVKEEGALINGCYQPFSWVPHATLAKTLNHEQMKAAFETMQSQFGTFESKVIKIGLAKTNPYTDLKDYALKSKEQTPENMKIKNK